MHTATKSSKFDISKKKNLEKIIYKISKKIKIGDALFLYGNIGIGKTTSARIFINFLQKRFNLKISEVPSPTFNIVHEYLIKNFIISHYDLYRLKSKKETDNIGLNEEIENKINIIEWPEKVKKKPPNRLELYFKYRNNFLFRTLKIKKYGRCKKYEIFEA